MADAVGCVTKAVELALKIKDAVDTVRQNRKDCIYIRRRVERVRHTLSLCEGNAELMENPGVRDAVEALAEVLGKALELVTGCQEETNAVHLCCTAGKLSKQLGKVDRGISDGNSEVTFAILVYYISKQTGDPATPTETQTGEIPEPLVLDETPEQTQECGVFQRPDSGACVRWIMRHFNKVLHCQQVPSDLSLMSPVTQRHKTVHEEILASVLHCREVPSDLSLMSPVTQRHKTVHEKILASGLYRQEVSPTPSDNEEDDYGDDAALLQEIARVALAIRTAMETVRRNKEECIEIDKRANRASVILSQLEDKETTEDTTVRGSLKSLLKTFRYAHELVAACQRRNVLVLCSPGNLSSDLRWVLDQMMLVLDNLIGVLL